MVRVSVILPVRNGENYLADALASVWLNLDNDDEVLVIDDGSTDDTAALLNTAQQNEPRLYVWKTDGVGPAGARNVGLAHARGAFITFIDHDDLWPAARLDRHLQRLATSQAKVIVGKTQYFSSDPQALAGFNFTGDDYALHHVHLGASTFCREVFDMVGMFDSSLMYSEDHDLFLRLREQVVPLHFTTDIALHYRIHTSNMTQTKSLHELNLFKVLRSSIKRRQLSGCAPLSIQPFKPE